MLKLILSKDWVRGRDAVLSCIAQDVANRQGGRILMVPELISHDMERRLCETAGNTASRYAEVLSFTRLSRRVADLVGSAAEECLDDGGRVVAMAAAARQLHSRLKAYAAVETKPEFLSGLVDAVDEFKRCCISSVDLREASARTEGNFAQKLEELSLLLETYDSLCARGKRDPRDQMTWLLEQLEDGTFGQEHVFYIDGFPDFTRQHLAILSYLIQVSPCVTVSLNCDAVDSKIMAYEKAGETASQLIRCARQSGVEVKIEYLDADAHPLHALREGLFQGRLHPEQLPEGMVKAFRADSVYRECMHTAEQILALVRSGCRYRDISVVCADMDVYANAIDMIFRRCCIPAYQSGTEDILQKSVVTTVLSAMDAALGGFERKDVLRYLKSALSPLSLEESDRMENYAILWGIDRQKWTKVWENHPDGLGEDWTDAAKAKLSELNAARHRAMIPLIHLQKGFADAKNLSQQVLALYAFLEEISLAQRLEGLSQELDAAGDSRNAQILNQLWEIILSALEQMHDVLGETAWDQETFTRLFTLLLSQYDVGTIPQVLDAVMVGPVSAMRCQQEKHLFVLGALEGCLPGYGGSKGVLNDQERVALRQMGIPLTGGAMEGLQAEFSEIYGVFCGADISVTVSCPAGQPSFVFRRIAQLAGGEQDVPAAIGPALADPLEAAAYLTRFGAQDEAKALSLQEAYSEVSARAAYHFGAVGPDNITHLYGTRLKLSASQVDRQAECRMSYFLKYGLRAKERKEAAVDPAEFGTYVHAVLEKTAKKVMELGGFRMVTQERTWEIAMQYSAEYAAERFSQLDSQRLSYLFQRNEHELEMVVRELWQELHCSAFTPVGFEVGFGDGKELPAIDISGRNMDAILRGFVDRVDVWNRYFRVVDYKTGRKSIDYCDLFNGIGLQMLLYLFALEQNGAEHMGGKMTPAGVQYFPARAPYLSTDGMLSDLEAEEERAGEWKRNGLLLADIQVLEAMEPEGSPHRLCCKQKNDGTLDGDIADREQLRMLKTYIFRILGKMVDEIASGNVTPNPYTRGSAHNACTYCPFGPLCHPAHVEGRRNYKTMSAQRFWEEIGKECDRNG